MVQRVVETETYYTFNKGNGDGRPIPRKRKISKKIRGRVTIKWKLLISAVILFISIFVITGILIYLNLGPYNYCRKGFIVVHIIPYLQSYLDPAVPPQEYLENDVFKSLSYVVDQLTRDVGRSFTVIETYPFWKWWLNQSDEVKNDVRKLINEGRFEIAGGGWCVPDEALVHYRSFIDQFTWGLRRLEEIADRKLAPDVAFSMDNHGHSMEIASLLKSMEFKAAMLGGISQNEQCYRRSLRKLEFSWRNDGIFVGNNGKPNILISILDDRTLKISDYFKRSVFTIEMNTFTNEVRSQAYGYSTNNMFVPVGGELRYNHIQNIFKCIDMLKNITAMNPKLDLKVVYSTPSNYIQSVEQSIGKWWNSLGDFLPYSEMKADYWTGYYSSRPTLKYLIRTSENFLQVLKQILSISNLGFEYSDSLSSLREAIGLSQHHKVLGVSSQKIVDSVNSQISEEILNASNTASKAINKISMKRNISIDRIGIPKLNYESCLKLNMSACRISEGNGSFIVTIYNPLHRTVNEYVRLPVTGKNYSVRTGDGRTLITQIVDLPQQIWMIPGRESNARRELIFRAMGIPALGFKSYFVSPIEETHNRAESTPEKDVSLVMDKLRKKIVAIKRNKEQYPFTHELMLYKSWLSRSSVFRPQYKAESITSYIHTEVLNQGKLVTEYIQNYENWAYEIIRVYEDEDFIEFQWIIGPIPPSSYEGKEIITAFKTNIKNKDIFYVDVNGRGFEEKQRSSQDDSENVGEYISKNYRPVNSHIAIKDENYQLHIFNDRAQGGVSAFQGQLELMIQRRLLTFNMFAKLEESLNEYVSEFIVTGRHWVFLGSSKDSDLNESIKKFAERSHSEPWYFLASASNISYEDWRQNYIAEFTGIEKEFPKNLKILTLEPWTETKILLRLENTGYIKLQINLKDMFSQFTITKATQNTLAGNGFKDSFTLSKSNPETNQGDELMNFDAFINPMEIITFILDIQPLS